MKRALLASVVALSFPAYGEVWDFTNPTGVIPSPHDYIGSAGTTVTVTAFGPNAPQLVEKNDGGDEVGLGETNNAIGEITPGSFLQLNLSNITNSPNLSFQAESATFGEAWQVSGSNTAGVLGTPLASCTASGGPGNSFEIITTINGLGNFKFADVTALGQDTTVLLKELDTVTVPGPIVGAGLPGLAVACGGLVAFARRRRKRG